MKPHEENLRTTKSAFFQELPLELREQIYHELLVDEYDALESQGRDPDHIAPKKILHLEILQTCQQANDEASQVFYERNFFRFEYPHYCVKRHGWDLFCGGEVPGGDSQRISHLEITFRSSSNQHICWRAKQILALVENIMDLRCSLKTLRLAFTLEEMHYYPQNFASSTFAANLDFIVAVAGVKVENKIEVIAASDVEGYCSMFEPFVKQVGYEKQWAVIEKKKIAKPDPEYDPDEDSDYKDVSDESDFDMEESRREAQAEIYGSEDREGEMDEASSEDSDAGTEGSNLSEWAHDVQSDRSYRIEHEHVWSWTLKPATATTKDNVPMSPPYGKPDDYVQLAHKSADGEGSDSDESCMSREW